MNERTITLEGLKHAQQVYKDKEYRELVYRAATALVDLALRNQINLTVAEALAVLLQSWNKAYYEFRPFTKEHLAEIARLVESPALDLFRDRPMKSCARKTKPPSRLCSGIFNRFSVRWAPRRACTCLRIAFFRCGITPLRSTTGFVWATVGMWTATGNSWRASRNRCRSSVERIKLARKCSRRSTSTITAPCTIGCSRETFHYSRPAPSMNRSSRRGRRDSGHLKDRPDRQSFIAIGRQSEVGPENWTAE